MTLSLSLSTRAALAAFACGALPLATFAQESHGGQPQGLLRAFPSPAPAIAVAPPDVALHLAEDLARGHRPLRYGALVELDATLGSGQWTTHADGSRSWRLRVVAPGAKSLAVEFDALQLPRGAEMFVFHEDVETVLGAYTHANHHEDGGFVFEPFPGQELVLEIDVPAGVPDPIVDTRAVIYDYRGIFDLMSGATTVAGGPGGGGSEFLGNCLIDVNCAQGNNWEFQKRATMRTLSSGALCSGALINNTANDGTRYVLTADHCGQTTSTVFTFRYQNSGCGTSNAPTNQTVSGCTVLTSNSTFDNRLLRINNAIPAAYQPYFAGWTRTTSNATFAFSMGHPSGGPKKISIDANGTSQETNMWRVGWSEGTLEGGSSGGPLFDHNGRVKGPACCVNEFTCTQTAWYGRFDRFWTANALAQWLDPLGTNPTSINAFDPYPPCAQPASVCFTSPNSVGSGALISSYGSTVRSANDFHLLVTDCPPNTSGIFFYGSSQTFSTFGNGFRCIANPVVRLPIVTTSPFGEATYDVDLDGTQIDAGETWYFQFWYRNPAGGGAGFNLSDALEAPFCAF